MGIEIPIPYFVWPSDVREEFERCDVAMWRLYNEINERGILERSDFRFREYLTWFQGWRKYYDETHEDWIAINAQTVATYNRIKQWETELIQWRDEAVRAKVANPPAVDPFDPPKPPAVKVDDTNFGPGMQAIGLGLVGVAAILALGYTARQVR